MLKMWLIIAALLVTVSTACATPTPVVSTVSWDAYTNTNGVGFYLYWRDKSNATSTYSNTNRFQITSITTISELISSVVPAIHPSSLCMVLTAYDGAGDESGYSNEVCGFVGMPSPTNAKGQ